MAAGLVAGLRHEESARFAFLLATPIILAAGLLEVPSLGADAPTLGVGIAAAALVWLVAYASARFLLRYLRLDVWTPSRITVRLSGPRASSSSTEGRELTC